MPSIEPGLTTAGRRLVWHGVLLFLLGLLVGMPVSAMANPRMGVSAHVGALLNGTFLIALGAAWGLVNLSSRTEQSAFWLLVAGSYGGSFGVFLAAVLGTHDSTPIHGAAQSASQWKETLVNLTLTVSGIVILVGTVMALRGLRRLGTKGQP